MQMTYFQPSFFAPLTELASETIVTTRVDATSYSDAGHRILTWAHERRSMYVCCATVSNIMEAYDSAGFAAVMNAADLVTPDGMPLVWALRLLGTPATRVYGPDLTSVILTASERDGTMVGFYGASAQTLERLLVNIRQQFPALRVVYSCSPPFRQMTSDEDNRVVQQIRAAGLQILFIGLGNPKQERWMADHRGRIDAVMVGVGAAFDFAAGTTPQAPRWMMGAGLEWLFRLMTEPRRLWKRYFIQNPRFLCLFARQLFRERLLEHRSR
jgi:N-acetylglucosaminyldiphosphoundecaprenol N-acetyl-beta-D-mannosaminyltransferase